MLDYKIIDAQDKDTDILISMKLVTMITDEMDKVLSYEDKNKIKKSITMNIDRTYYRYKMILVDNKVAGAYLIIPHEDGYMIDQLYLFEEYRNQGIGTSIIGKITKKHDNLYVWVYRSNKDALRLLERLGFNVINSNRTMILKYDKVYVNIKDKLNEIGLGYVDKDGNKYSGFRSDFKDKFYLQSPKQLMESKIGTCFEHVELERELISRLGVDSRTYYVMYPDDDMDIAHTFLIYKDSKKYYWVENAWLKHRGLHIYNNKDALLYDVLNKFVATIPGGEFDKVKLYLYDKPRFGSTYAKYLSNCINGRGVKLK